MFSSSRTLLKDSLNASTREGISAVGAGIAFLQGLEFKRRIVQIEL